MYDYDYILRLLDRAGKMNEQLEQSIEHHNDETGKSQVVQDILHSLAEHYHKYHPNPMVVETDLSGNVAYANDNFLKACRYSASELIGENINILRSSTMEKGVFTDLWNHISAGKPWAGQIQNRSKDYATFWVDTLIMPVLDVDGKPTKYWSFSYDITEEMNQKLEFSKKSDDVSESLKYAKRIQKTILPDKKDLDDALGNDHFVLFKPKEEVSGDFYWCKKIENLNFIAAVDCTGHGVPGAFMSIIGYSALNQIVAALRIFDPGEILAELHKTVRSLLKQDEEGTKTKDGMDISMIVTDDNSNIVKFAGANNPLFWWHKGELQQIKADKYSIGGEQLEEERTYTSHTIEAEDGDCMYLFSDGVVDQFGGPEIKKFSTKRLKSLIEEYHQEKMTIQRAKINIAWKDWVQDDEQTDDVTMIGVRLEIPRKK